jgi:hypothetical protein
LSVLSFSEEHASDRRLMAYDDSLTVRVAGMNMLWMKGDRRVKKNRGKDAAAAPARASAPTWVGEMPAPRLAFASDND